MPAVPHPRRTTLQSWLRIDPANRPLVYAQIYETADFTSCHYWLGIVFSAGIATFGLVQSSPAVIIGAMLISPLMGPIMATGLGLAVGDFYLALKALATLLASIIVAIGLSALIVWVLPFHSETPEILARINPTLLDLGIALFSGLAGSVLVGRSGGSDGVTALPGVAIAVALMPPLCTMGFGMGCGWNTRIMGGAGLLFLTNLVAIVSSAFVIFLLIGMNAEELADQIDRCRQGEFLARNLTQRRAGQALLHGGRLHWRFLVLVALLAAVAVPLKRAFVQVAGETAARGAVQQVIHNLLPPGALLSQQVDVGKDSISIRIFTTREISPAQITRAEQEIQQRARRTASIAVSSVASQSELARMMDQLKAIPMNTPAPPPPQTIDQVRTQLIDRISPVVTAAWPPEAPLASFDVALKPDNLTIQATYQAHTPLTPIALSLITRQLQQQLNEPTLALTATRVPPPRSPRQTEPHAASPSR